MTTDTLTRELIKRHEGYRRFVYHCSEGKATVGYGRNIEPTGPGISEREAEYLLDSDLDRVLQECHSRFTWFSSLNAARKAVIISMVFNLGVKGVQGFWKMCAAIDCGDFLTAAFQMRHSIWRHQVGRRAIELSLMMESGDFVTEQEIEKWLKTNS